MQPNQYNSKAVAFITALILHCSFASAGGLVRVSDGKQSYEGKVLAMAADKCSLLDRQGRILRLRVSSLKSFEKVSPRFQPLPTTAFRQQLVRDFPGYEVVGSTHYLVCAPRGKASKYVKLFDSVYRDVEQFFRVRGFRVAKPETPLVAVVFGSQNEFVKYCVQDKVPPSPTLMGYYSLVSNRVALFDSGDLVQTTPGKSFVSEKYESICAAAGLAGDTANTIIHETTHQVGHNIGIHSRVGSTPTWLLEGLATALEPAAMRSNRGRNLVSEKLNPERSMWFKTEHLPRRRAGNLAALIASDDYFRKDLLDSYSEAWAFTFFLLENRKRCQDLVKYIQLLAERDPALPYSAKERLTDFQTCFGDISRLEVEFLRSMDRL